MNKLVSIIVPVYNVEKYLNCCIESIINQTYKNLEIILIDDGSTDGSPQICDRYQSIDSRIKVVHKENEGQARARNIGFEMSTGEYIEYVDSDDFISVNTCEKMVELIELHDADMVCFNSVRCQSETDIDDYSDDTDEIKLFTSGEAILLLLNKKYTRKKEFQISPCYSLFKRDTIRNIRFPEGLIYEDGYYFPQTVLNADKIVHIDKTFYFHRYNPNSTMSAGVTEKGLASIDDWEFLHGKIKEKFPEYAHFAARRWVMRLLKMYDYLIQTDEVDKSGNCKKHIIEKVKENYSYFIKATDDKTLKKKLKILNKCPEKYYKKVFKQSDFIKLIKKVKVYISVRL